MEENNRITEREYNIELNNDKWPLITSLSTCYDWASLCEYTNTCAIQLPPLSYIE